ncbi:MAG: DNA polymerase III subunit gamma/tau [Verrucomicrobiales bacterium]|nr:DNA polymerase III subunit gamma/tau [Verrucomicrobiales bacterium]
MSESYQVFARKYRPRTFADVLGQDHVVQTLRNAIEQNRLAHAYLFVGPRGTGKTTTARILAKALNCSGGPKVEFDPDEDVCIEIAEGRSLNVLEIDGASNRGIDHIRDLRESVKYAPAGGKFRIYYIDEVHMLTKESFNALLKTLEEPPAHVKFIFATTEPDKILPTILSRCQRFDLRRIPARIIAEHLLHIARNEGIELSEPAAYAIAKGADGGMRDAQSMLDQLVAFCGNAIGEKDVLEIFGFNSVEAIADLAGVILRQDTGQVLTRIHEQSEAGRDLGKLLADLITHFRLLLVQLVDPRAETEEVSPELRAILNTQVGLITTDRLLQLIDQLAETDGKMKWAPNKKLHLEIGLIKAIRRLGETSIDDVIALISEAAGGAPAPDRPAPVQPAAPPSTSPPAASPPTPTASPAPPPASQPEPPIARTQAPEPTTAPPPVAEVRPAPSGPISGEALWQTTCAELIADRPLIQTWLQAAAFVEHGSNAFTIGIPSDLGLYRDSLIRHKAAIEEILARLSGSRLELRIELRDDVQVSLPVIDDTPDAPASADPDPAPVALASAKPEPEPADSADPEPDPAPAPPVDDFHNDPFIRKALDIFEATILRPQQA